MRLKINIPVFAVVGAAALFAVLTGSARAIPDPASSWVSSNEQSDYDALRSIGRNDFDQSPTSLSSLVVFGADLKENNGRPHELRTRHFDRDDHGVPGSASISVPDGGMTVMMLSGSLCVLMLLGKKTKV